MAYRFEFVDAEVVKCYNAGSERDIEILILRDKKTRVLYITKGGNDCESGFTPLLDKDGKPLISLD